MNSVPSAVAARVWGCEGGRCRRCLQGRAGGRGRRGGRGRGQDCWRGGMMAVAVGPYILQLCCNLGVTAYGRPCKQPA